MIDQLAQHILIDPCMRQAYVRNSGTYKPCEGRLNFLVGDAGRSRPWRILFAAAPPTPAGYYARLAADWTRPIMMRFLRFSIPVRRFIFLFRFRVFLSVFFFHFKFSFYQFPFYFLFNVPFLVQFPFTVIFSALFKIVSK